MLASLCRLSPTATALYDNNLLNRNIGNCEPTIMTTTFSDIPFSEHKNQNSLGLLNSKIWDFLDLQTDIWTKNQKALAYEFCICLDRTVKSARLTEDRLRSDEDWRRTAGVLQIANNNINLTSIGIIHSNFRFKWTQILMIYLIGLTCDRRETECPRAEARVRRAVNRRSADSSQSELELRCSWVTVVLTVRHCSKYRYF